MRWLTALLMTLLLLIQYPLWFGKGGWLRVAELERKVTEQQHTNDTLRARNASLAGDVKDLQSGTDAIEERARYELGMTKPDEVFVQIVPERK